MVVAAGRANEIHTVLVNMHTSVRPSSVCVHAAQLIARDREGEWRELSILRTYTPKRPGGSRSIFLEQYPPEAVVLGGAGASLLLYLKMNLAYTDETSFPVGLSSLACM